MIFISIISSSPQPNINSLISGHFHNERVSYTTCMRHNKENVLVGDKSVEREKLLFLSTNRCVCVL